MSRIRTLASLAILAILAISVTACDRKEDPTAPSQIVVGAGVSVVGTVTAPVPSGLQVSGGGNTAQVDGAGQFALTNLPSGTLDLRFAGVGVSGSLVLNNVLANQAVALVVSVSGTSVTLESSRRVRGSDEEIEGRIESMATDTLVVAGRSVSTSGGTSFTASGQACTFLELAVDQRINAKGQATSGSLIAAAVDILTPITIGNLSVSGSIANFSGTRTAFQFTVGSTQIQADDATAFDSGSQFAELGNGLSIQVAGAQRSGHVYATRLTITAQPTSFTGRIIMMSGTPPELVLTVATDTAMVTARTDIRRKGEPQSANSIDNGQTVEINGRLIADGTVVASRLNILTDAPGGSFLMTGTISAIVGSCPQIQLTVSSYTISTSSATTFTGSTCAGLASGNRVEVTGIVQQDFSVAATSIKKL